MDGNDGKTIVTAQRTENGVDLGIDKAGSRDSGLQVIQANHVYRATKPVEGILDTTDEGLQILPPDDLLIRVAGITQHCLEQVGATVPARFGLCQSCFAKVHLHVPTGWSFHPSEDSWTLGFELSAKPFDGVIRSIEAMLQNQVLPDPLGMQPQLKLLLDFLPKRLTRAAQTRGPLWPLLLTRAGGHFGRF